VIGEYIALIQRAEPDFSNKFEGDYFEGAKAFARLTSSNHCGEFFGIVLTER
jgi:hypothetical protein